MNISSVSSSNTSSAASFMNKKNQIEQLNKQIEKLQEQITKIKEDDTINADTKRDKILILQNQITDIEEMKRTLETETLKPATTKENKKENPNEKANSDGDIFNIDPAAAQLLEMSNNLERIESLQSSKAGIGASINILKSEIKIDTDRGADVTKKSGQLAKAKQNLTDIDKSIAKTINAASTSSGSFSAVTPIKEEEEDKAILEKEKQGKQNEEQVTIDKLI